ncbi:MAG: hypothetical protein M1450_01320 [Patescibacteria group bacterium]|nr:hypothetical protein [Patescibacteria group bacterium]
MNPYTGDLLIYEIDADKIPYRMIVGSGYHLALVSRNNKLAIFIGTPNPPFNYDIKEQIDIDPKIVEQRIKEGLIKIKRFSCTEEGVNPI